MTLDLSALKTEVTTDPKTLGYSSLSDRGVASKLNEVGASVETIDVAEDITVEGTGDKITILFC